MSQESQEPYPSSPSEDESDTDSSRSFVTVPQTLAESIQLEGLLQHMQNDEFCELLRQYPEFRRESCHPFDNDRFDSIPQNLAKMPMEKRYLTKGQLIAMDQWMRKQGIPLDHKKHKQRTAEIERNRWQNIESITKRAFTCYGAGVTDTAESGDNAELAWEAMGILQRLRGIDESRACLLLSVAFPKTVPFCSNAMFRWVHGVQGNDDDSPWPQDKNDYTAIFRDTERIRHQFTRTIGNATEEVLAVDVEKVAFVLERMAKIEAFRKPWITEGLISSGNEIGSGAFGKVYRVSSRSSRDRPDTVAVKAIRASQHEPGEEDIPRGKILNEILISNQVAERSPQHFVKSFGWNENPRDGCYYLAMEHVAHGDLETVLKAPNLQWSEKTVRSIARQILEGLDCMHRELITHRDLKPQNILVSSLLEGDVRVKIADFGISKMLSHRGTTGFRTAIGTEGYKAREVLKSYDSQDRRIPGYSYLPNVDVWSLSCILFRIVKGSPLFRRDHLVTDKPVLKSTVKSVPKELRNSRINISESGIRFIQALMVIKPEKRPHAKQALSALEKWGIDGEEGLTDV
ncbi:kinase-like domain-containing protein [Nemania sp. NC0429]|nr:kinase-like domain-containing protein [Nemania sp. NC0429]